ncbi:MAG: acyl carrier protein [Pseudomonadota bacterium]
MENFLKYIADILEVAEVKLTDKFENFPEWDSLAVLSVIAMVDANYRVKKYNIKIVKHIFMIYNLHKMTFMGLIEK